MVSAWPLEGLETKFSQSCLCSLGPSKNAGHWASLVAQWLRIRLPMQGTRVRALVQEYPTYHGATKPVCHNYWACTLEPASHNYWAHVPQLLKPACLEPVLRNGRGHLNEKPAHHHEEWPLLAATRESPSAATKTQRSQKKIKEINLKKKTKKKTLDTKS